MRKKQVAVYLQEEDHKKIKAIAQMLGRDVSGLFEEHAKDLIKAYEGKK